MSFSYFHKNKCIHNLIHYVVFIILCSGVLKSFQQDVICSEDATKESCLNPVNTILTLKKRDDKLAKYIANAHGMHVKGQPFMESNYFIEHNSRDYYRKKRSTIYSSIKKHPDVVSIESDYARERVSRGYLNENNLPYSSISFNDPLYKYQWYLHGKNDSGRDMNIHKAWLMGYSGKNITVAVIDDGLQFDHPDLAKNYNPFVSIDISNNGNNPIPGKNKKNKSDHHGTMCAGIIASVANNNKCGVGVAFNSKIGGIKISDVKRTDGADAAAFSFKQKYIDIYSSSWGPVDNGKVFGGLAKRGRKAIYKGIKKGRNGKGNIFVWASGNGGRKGDSCSADSYVTSIYTISIASATYYNKKADFAENCPAIIASAYSSGNFLDPRIVSTNAPTGCTKSFGGTSASTAMASGIIALALEANPLLTWRDVQHLTLRTANSTPLLNNTGWSTNGVGRKFSYYFGYGLMDAEAFVKLAKVWKTVPEQHLCSYKHKLSEPSPRPVSGKFKINFTIDASDCANGKPVIYLEHVQVISTIKYSRRGDLRLTLFSPKGTASVILPIRPNDNNNTGIVKWPFLSVQMWGEDPRGIWTLMIESISKDETTYGTIHDWNLLLYGTEEPAQPTDHKNPSVTISPNEATNYQGFYESGSKKLLKLYKNFKNS